MVEATDANAGYDDFVEAVADGEGAYLACPNGHGSLPPRRACPRCGSTDLSSTSLPATGEVETYTVVHVPTPQLADDAPHVTAIARFGPVLVTGFLRGVDRDASPVGTTVVLGVEPTETEDERALVLRPV